MNSVVSLVFETVTLILLVAGCAGQYACSSQTINSAVTHSDGSAFSCDSCTFVQRVVISLSSAATSGPINVNRCQFSGGLTLLKLQPSVVTIVDSAFSSDLLLDEVSFVSGASASFSNCQFTSLSSGARAIAANGLQLGFASTMLIDGCTVSAAAEAILFTDTKLLNGSTLHFRGSAMTSRTAAAIRFHTTAGYRYVSSRVYEYVGRSVDAGGSVIIDRTELNAPRSVGCFTTYHEWVTSGDTFRSTAFGEGSLTFLNVTCANGTALHVNMRGLSASAKFIGTLTAGQVAIAGDTLTSIDLQDVLSIIADGPLKLDSARIEFPNDDSWVSRFSTPLLQLALYSQVLHVRSSSVIAQTAAFDELSLKLTRSSLDWDGVHISRRFLLSDSSLTPSDALVMCNSWIGAVSIESSTFNGSWVAFEALQLGRVGYAVDSAWAIRESSIVGGSNVSLRDVSIRNESSIAISLAAVYWWSTFLRSGSSVSIVNCDLSASATARGILLSGSQGYTYVNSRLAHYRSELIFDSNFTISNVSITASAVTAAPASCLTAYQTYVVSGDTKEHWMYFVRSRVVVQNVTCSANSSPTPSSIDLFGKGGNFKVADLRVNEVKIEHTGGASVTAAYGIVAARINFLGDSTTTFAAGAPFIGADFVKVAGNQLQLPHLSDMNATILHVHKYGHPGLHWRDVTARNLLVTLEASSLMLDGLIAESLALEDCIVPNGTYAVAVNNFTLGRFSFSGTFASGAQLNLTRGTVFDNSSASLHVGAMHFGKSSFSSRATLLISNCSVRSRLNTAVFFYDSLFTSNSSLLIVGSTIATGGEAALLFASTLNYQYISYRHRRYHGRQLRSGGSISLRDVTVAAPRDTDSAPRYCISTYRDYHDAASNDRVEEWGHLEGGSLELHRVNCTGGSRAHVTFLAGTSVNVTGFYAIDRSFFYGDATTAFALLTEVPTLSRELYVKSSRLNVPSPRVLNVQNIHFHTFHNMSIVWENFVAMNLTATLENCSIVVRNVQVEILRFFQCQQLDSTTNRVDLVGVTAEQLRIDGTDVSPYDSVFNSTFAISNSTFANGHDANWARDAFRVQLTRWQGSGRLQVVDSRFVTAAHSAFAARLVDTVVTGVNAAEEFERSTFSAPRGGLVWQEQRSMSYAAYRLYRGSGVHAMANATIRVQNCTFARANTYPLSTFVQYNIGSDTYETTAVFQETSLYLFNNRFLEHEAQIHVHFRGKSSVFAPPPAIPIQSVTFRGDSTTSIYLPEVAPGRYLYVNSANATIPDLDDVPRHTFVFLTYRMNLTYAGKSTVPHFYIGGSDLNVTLVGNTFRLLALREMTLIRGNRVLIGPNQVNETLQIDSVTCQADARIFVSSSKYRAIEVQTSSFSRNSELHFHDLVVEGNLTHGISVDDVLFAEGSNFTITDSTVRTVSAGYRALSWSRSASVQHEHSFFQLHNSYFGAVSDTISIGNWYTSTGARNFIHNGATLWIANVVVADVSGNAAFTTYSSSYGYSTTAYNASVVMSNFTVPRAMRLDFSGGTRVWVGDGFNFASATLAGDSTTTLVIDEATLPSSPDVPPFSSLYIDSGRFSGPAINSLRGTQLHLRAHNNASVDFFGQSMPQLLVGGSNISVRLGNCTFERLEFTSLTISGAANNSVEVDGGKPSRTAQLRISSSTITSGASLRICNIDADGLGSGIDLYDSRVSLRSHVVLKNLNISTAVDSQIRVRSCMFQSGSKLTITSVNVTALSRRTALEISDTSFDGQNSGLCLSSSSLSGSSTIIYLRGPYIWWNSVSNFQRNDWSVVYQSDVFANGAVMGIRDTNLAAQRSSDRAIVMLDSLYLSYFGSNSSLFMRNVSTNGTIDLRFRTGGRLITQESFNFTDMQVFGDATTTVAVTTPILPGTSRLALHAGVRWIPYVWEIGASTLEIGPYHESIVFRNFNWSDRTIVVGGSNSTVLFENCIFGNFRVAYREGLAQDWIAVRDSFVVGSVSVAFTDLRQGSAIVLSNVSANDYSITNSRLDGASLISFSGDPRRRRSMASGRSPMIVSATTVRGSSMIRFADINMNTSRFSAVGVFDSRFETRSQLMIDNMRIVVARAGGSSVANTRNDPDAVTITDNTFANSNTSLCVRNSHLQAPRTAMLLHSTSSWNYNHRGTTFYGGSQFTDSATIAIRDSTLAGELNAFTNRIDWYSSYPSVSWLNSGAQALLSNVTTDGGDVQLFATSLGTTVALDSMCVFNPKLELFVFGDNNTFICAPTSMIATTVIPKEATRISDSAFQTRFRPALDAMCNEAATVNPGFGVHDTSRERRPNIFSVLPSFEGYLPCDEGWFIVAPVFRTPTSSHSATDTGILTESRALTASSSVAETSTHSVLHTESLTTSPSLTDSYIPHLDINNPLNPHYRKPSPTVSPTPTETDRDLINRRNGHGGTATQTLVRPRTPAPTEDPSMRQVSVQMSGTQQQAVSAAGNAAVATSFLSGAADATSLQGLLVLGFSKCASPTMQQLSAKSRSSLTPFDGLLGDFAANGVLASALVCLGVLTLQLGVAFVLQRAKGLPHFCDACAKVRAPSVTLTVTTLLYQGAALSSAQILLVYVDVTATDRLVAGLCLVVCAAAPLIAAWAVYQLHEEFVYKPYTRLFARSSWLSRALLLPRGYFVENRSLEMMGSVCSMMNGVSKFKWALVTYLRALLVAVVVSLDGVSCDMQVGLLMLIFFLSAVVASATAMYRTRLSEVINAAMCAISAAVPLLTLLGDTHATAPLLTVAGVLPLAGVALSLFLRWKERKWVPAEEALVTEKPDNNTAPLLARPRRLPRTGVPGSSGSSDSASSDANTESSDDDDDAPQWQRRRRTEELPADSLARNTLTSPNGAAGGPEFALVSPLLSASSFRRDPPREGATSPSDDEDDLHPMLPGWRSRHRRGTTSNPMLTSPLDANVDDEYDPLRVVVTPARPDTDDDEVTNASRYSRGQMTVRRTASDVSSSGERRSGSARLVDNASFATNRGPTPFELERAAAVASRQRRDSLTLSREASRSGVVSPPALAEPHEQRARNDSFRDMLRSPATSDISRARSRAPTPREPVSTSMGLFSNVANGPGASLIDDIRRRKSTGSLRPAAPTTPQRKGSLAAML